MGEKGLEVRQTVFSCLVIVWEGRGVWEGGWGKWTYGRGRREEREGVCGRGSGCLEGEGVRKGKGCVGKGMDK